jgi:hypothetical protein
VSKPKGSAPANSQLHLAHVQRLHHRLLLVLAVHVWCAVRHQAPLLTIFITTQPNTGQQLLLELHHIILW